MKNASSWVINWNGKLIQATNEGSEEPYLHPEAKTSLFDRGFLYGDSLYEVIRTYDGIPFELDGHFERLAHSARLAKMDMGPELDRIKKEVIKTLSAFQAANLARNADAYCRIIISRGVGKVSFSQKAIRQFWQFAVMALPIEEFLPPPLTQGISLQVSARVRNSPLALDPAMKSGNYLNSLLAYLEASEKGYDDALLCNSDGHLTEGSTFNFFYARNGVLATPPLDIGILDGLTRKHVIDLARAEGIEVREVRFPKERLYEADEAFLTGSIKEVFPITHVDGRKIGNGKIGPLTCKLASLYHEHAIALCQNQNQKQNQKK